MKKYWTRMLPLICLAALLCGTLAAADARPVALNCHEMAEVFFGGGDEAQLLGASDSPEEAALADYFTAREAAYRGDTRLLSGGGDWNASTDVADSNELRAAQVRDMERRLGINVLDADVTTRVDRAETVRNPDGTLTLYVYEWTFYDYDDLADGVGGQDVSGFGTWHILTVQGRPDGSCEILSDEYDESDILGVNTLSAEHMRDTGDDIPYDDAETDSASLLATSYYVDYDVDKAVAYAEQYWGGDPDKTYKEGGTQSGEEFYNKSYASFNKDGGDCANFTSQCISAGGMPQVVTKAYGNDGWYYKTAKDRSATWTGATNLRQWMANNRGHLVYLVTWDKEKQESSTANNAKYNVFTGSPVFYSTKADGTFQHAVLCVGTNSAGTPVINSHNTNRWHALWSYYTGSKVIDTVQLTSKSFGSFSGYVKLADDFHAFIVNSSLISDDGPVTRYVTNSGGGVVASCEKAQEEEKVSGQIWRFRLQDDGSYKILSALNGEDSPALAAKENGWASRTTVCTEPYQDEPGQQWYLYQYGTAADGETPLYNFRPKCSDRVMDIKEENAENGTEIWIFSKNGTGAQLFEIQETDWVSIDKPILWVAAGGTNGANITFSWDALPGAATYILRVSQGNKQLSPVTIMNLNSYGMTLQPGNGYQATLEAVSANERTSSISDPVSFDVATAFVVSYDANGGEDAPDQQMKMEKKPLILSTKIPVYPGHTFDSWNVSPNGIGTSYAPGEVYNKDADMTLYARWNLKQYTVTLDPNGGKWQDEEEPVTVKVTYSRSYGRLPEPILIDHEFAGWYTEPEGGEQITADSSVQLKEDGTMYETLYAHWHSSIPYIDSTVMRDNTRHVINVLVYHVPKGILFVCGYMDGQMVDAVSSTLEESTELNRVVKVTLDGNFDSIRVFALSGDEHRPACQCNVVEKKEFL